MDRNFGPVLSEQRHELQERTISTGAKVETKVVVEVVNDECVVDCVNDVGIGDAAFASRIRNIHTVVSYYKTGPSHRRVRSESFERLTGV